MTKPKVTRTYGPIHFDDLDPHRFEDLIRELIYDYKNWQSIEATGKGGSDDGFDIRAYEKTDIVLPSENEESDEVEVVHPMDGNMWMVQIKREKQIGPKKIKEILSEIDPKNPPYGYILAASATFSKKSYDIFREELRKKGVMEFHMWGNAKLEDMLHQPKNDRILFTFFGISLASKKRTRTTEVRSSIIIKNKLFRTVGEGRQFHQPILTRDLKDTKYPYRNEYKDFKKKPRWKEYIACDHHPLGLWCNVYKHFAFIDIEKKEWDFTKEINLVQCERENESERLKKVKKQELVNNFWDFLANKNKGHLVVDGIIKYGDIALIDDKGDVSYNVPHIYVDFFESRGPFAGFRKTIIINEQEIDLANDYKRVDIFPKKYIKHNPNKIYKNKKITFNQESLKEFKGCRLHVIYETEGKYDFLKPRDVIQVKDSGIESDEELIQITYKFKEKYKFILKQSLVHLHKTKNNIKTQLGREPKDNEELYVYEFKRINKWELEKK